MRVLLIATIVLLALVFVNAVPPLPRLIWNASASAPIGLYDVDTHAVPAPGMLVAVQPPHTLAIYMAERRYLPLGLPLLKHVAALAGAKTCRAGPTVTINGTAVATALTRDHAGRTLPVWTGCRVLAAGAIFLLNPVPDSFDSRYFGTLPLTSVIGEASPLLILEPGR